MMGIIHSWDFIALIYTYKYFGVFDPETMPRADPVWIPIRSCNRALGMWGILKTIDAHKRSKAMDAISETCLFPTIMKLYTLKCYQSNVHFKKIAIYIFFVNEIELLPLECGSPEIIINSLANSPTLLILFTLNFFVLESTVTQIKFRRSTNWNWK